MWSLDLDTGVIELEGDSFYKTITGMPEIANVETHYKLIHPEDVITIAEKFKNISEENPDYDMELRIKHTNIPQWYWMHSKGKLKTGTRMVYGVIMDITKEKELLHFYKTSLDNLSITKNYISELTSSLERI